MLKQLRKWFRSYFFQILIASVGLILLSNVITVILLDQNMTEELKEIYLSRQEQGAEASFFVLEPELYDLIEGLMEFGDSYPDFHQTIMDEGEDYLDTSEAFSALFFIDGRTMETNWISGDRYNLDMDLKRVNAVQRAFEGDYTFSGKIEEDNQSFVILAGPVMKDGNFLGVIGGVLSLDYSSIIQGSLKPLEKESLIYLVDDAGEVIGTNSPVMKEYRVDPEIFSRLKYSDTNHYDDGRYLYSIYPMENLDWSIIVETPNDQVYGPVFEIRKLNFFILAIILLISIIFTTLIAVRIHRPLMDLIRQIKSWRTKKMPHRLQVKGNLEMETLVEAYNEFLKEMHEEQTKRLVQQKMLLQNEKLATIGRLSAGIVHEIRNPLTPVKGFLQLLENAVDKKDRQYVDLALRELDRVNLLVNSLLDLSRPDKVKPETKQILYLKEVTEQVIMLTEANLYKKNISFTYDIPEHLPALWGNKDALIQVMYNICNNAIEAMEKNGGALDLSISTLHDQVSITVSDTGEGMDNETIRKVTSPFFTTKEAGTGLGLYVTKSILEDHHATMTIESEQGKGTQVTIAFPIYDPTGERFDK